MGLSGVLAEEEKIRVLLAEYSSLRSEIVARLGHAYQLMAVGTAVLAAIAALQPNRPLLYGIVGFVLAVFLIGCWFVYKDLYKLGHRVREIEHDVNRRAGEHLLVWESLWGGLATGLWRYGKPLPRSTLPTLPRLASKSRMRK
jgi:hypothetical protein